MFAPTLPYQVEAGAWDPSWGPSSDTRGGVSYLLLGGMGSWLPTWYPLTRGRGIVPCYPRAGTTALTPYLAVTPVRRGALSTASTAGRDSGSACRCGWVASFFRGCL